MSLDPGLVQIVTYVTLLKSGFYKVRTGSHSPRELWPQPQSPSPEPPEVGADIIPEWIVALRSLIDIRSITNSYPRMDCGSPFLDRHTVDHKFFLRCCSRYTLQASGSTLGSAMTPALSFVMTRASSWLGPVARLHRCDWPALSKVGEPLLTSPTQCNALLNEVGQQQRQRDTEHNHDHRRHAAPQA